MHPARVIVAAFVVLAAVTAGGATPGAAQGSTPVDVIVVFEEDATRNATAVRAAGGTVTGGWNVSLLPVLFARVPERAISGLERHPDVRFVERDRETESVAQTTPWGITHIDARSAANDVNDSAEANVTVAVLDTGIDYDHPDLEANVAWGVNTVGSGEPSYGVVAADDDNGHGTHVAGTVAAVDNDFGVVGVAPGVGLYSIKVLGADGTGTYSDFIQGLDEAVKGPDGEKGTADDPEVLSMSLGGTEPSQSLKAAVEDASEYAILVGAVGNAGDGNASTNDVTYPAKYEAVIGVAAVDDTNSTPSWSSEGAEVELAAPGVDVVSTYLDDQYARTSGTSMAAPHVAGTVALVIAEDLEDGQRNRSDAEIRTALQETAVDLGPEGRDNTTGYGLVQADRAIGTTVVELNLTANRTNVTVGGAIGFTVARRDTGENVTATVSVAGRTKQTDQNGTVAFTLTDAGTFTATATKNETATTSFENDTVTVTVSKETVALNLTANESSVTVGERVRFTVTREDTGATTNATVTVGNDSYDTGDDGIVTVAFQEAGTVTANATKPETDAETFSPDTVSVSVRREEVELTIAANATNVSGGDAVAFTVRPNDTNATVNATVTVDDRAYTTGDDGTVTVRFFIDGNYTATASKPATASERYVNASVLIRVNGTAGPGDVTGNGKPARDHDGDGLFEDVDGNGVANFDDAVDLAFLDFSTLSPRFFDFDGDGDVDFDDAVELAFLV